MVYDTPRPATRLVAVDATGGECRDANGTVLARPGDVVTCPDGHPIWEVVDPIIAGVTLPSASVRSVSDGTKPNSGVAQPCPNCGRKLFAWVAPATFGLYVGGHLVSGDREVA